MTSQAFTTSQRRRPSTALHDETELAWINQFGRFDHLGHGHVLNPRGFAGVTSDGQSYRIDKQTRAELGFRGKDAMPNHDR